METFKEENYNAIVSDGYGSSAGYYRSKDNKTIVVSTICKCDRRYYQLWKQATFKCFSCEENEKLKKQVEKIELENKNWKVSHEDFIDKSQNWHQQQLVQKDEEFKELSKQSFEEINYWKKKMESLEEKFNQLETKYSELIVKEN